MSSTPQDPQNEPPDDAPSAASRDVEAWLAEVHLRLYPFSTTWEQADAALSDDASADRRRVRQEYDWLTARTRPGTQDDPVGVLGPVLARLRSTTGSQDSVWCAGGWSRLIAETDRRLADLDPDYQLWQVKEKFGGLRFYATPSTLLVQDQPASRCFRQIVQAAETASGFLCEVCGRADGSLRGRPPRRIRTLCDTHRAWGVRL